MEVGRLPISASQRGKLISAGYTSLSSLSSLSPSVLAKGDLFFKHLNLLSIFVFSLSFLLPPSIFMI